MSVRSRRSICRGRWCSEPGWTPRTGGGHGGPAGFAPMKFMVSEQLGAATPCRHDLRHGMQRGSRQNADSVRRHLEISMGPSLPMRERGSKHRRRGANRLPLRSLSMRECGSKRIARAGAVGAVLVALPTKAWIETRASSTRCASAWSPSSQGRGSKPWLRLRSVRREAVARSARARIETCRPAARGQAQGLAAPARARPATLTIWSQIPA